MPSLSLFSSKQCIIKQLLVSVFVILYINDVHFCSKKFNFLLFADDTNILYADKNLKSIELTVNHSKYLITKIIRLAQRKEVNIKC